MSLRKLCELNVTVLCYAVKQLCNTDFDRKKELLSNDNKTSMQKNKLTYEKQNSECNILHTRQTHYMHYKS